jgi:heme a synthase
MATMANILSPAPSLAHVGAKPATGTHRAVGVWLAAVAALVFAMILVGGLTRLTDSGLSITEWALVHGVLPPLNPAQWEEAFAAYRETPEYRIQNRGMGMEAFQVIFWWEWGHRLLGRLIGLAFMVPLVGFALARMIPARLWPMLVIMLALGALQGAIGWWMVSSGLVGDRLDVAAYRLATHLSMAFVLFALLSWTALDVLKPRPAGAGEASLVPWALVLLVGLAVQVVLGAFVAGTDAGFVYNEWPLMQGRVVPEGYGALQPFSRNLVENHATIQFNHRIGAYLVALLVVATWWQARRSRDRGVRAMATMVLAVTQAQVVLGVATLVGYGIWTPPQTVGLVLGVAHQGLGAIVVMAGALLLRAAWPGRSGRAHA